MNAFVEHPQDSIRFTYSCFDRILLNAIIQPLQYPAGVVGFLKNKRQAAALTPAYFRAMSTDYHQFVRTFAADRQVEIVEPPKGDSTRRLGGTVLPTLARPAWHRRDSQEPRERPRGCQFPQARQPCRIAQPLRPAILLLRA